MLVGMLPLPWRPFKEAERVYHYSRSTSEDSIPIVIISGVQFVDGNTLKYEVQIGNEKEEVSGASLKSIGTGGISSKISLDLDSNELSDHSLHHLGLALAAARDSCFSEKGRSKPSLALSLQENLLTSHSCRLLSSCSIASYPSAECVITSLNLSWNPIGDDGIRALAPALRYLQVLRVEGCCLANQAVDALVNASPSRWVLEDLSLAHNTSIPEVFDLIYRH